MLRFFDLFCGGGGSSLGAIRAGAVCVGGLDIWPTACRLFAHNTNARAFCGDAMTMAIPDCGQVDLLLASPECVSHSTARGNRPRKFRSENTAWAVLRFARQWRPRFVVVENVPAMTAWPSWERWHAAWKRMGYEPTYGILNAADFGVPQTRKRLFVVLSSTGKAQLPAPTVDQHVGAGTIVGVGLADHESLFRPIKSPRVREAVIRHADRLGDQFIVVLRWRRPAYPLTRPLPTVMTANTLAIVHIRHCHPLSRMLRASELAAAMGFPADYAWQGLQARDRRKILGNAVCPPVMQAIVQAIVDNLFSGG